MTCSSLVGLRAASGRWHVSLVGRPRCCGPLHLVHEVLALTRFQERLLRFGRLLFISVLLLANSLWLPLEGDVATWRLLVRLQVFLAWKTSVATGARLSGGGRPMRRCRFISLQPVVTRRCSRATAHPLPRGVVLIGISLKFSLDSVGVVFIFLGLGASNTFVDWKICRFPFQESFLLSVLSTCITGHIITIGQCVRPQIHELLLEHFFESRRSVVSSGHDHLIDVGGSLLLLLLSLRCIIIVVGIQNNWALFLVLVVALRVSCQGSFIHIVVVVIILHHWLGSRLYHVRTCVALVEHDAGLVHLMRWCFLAFAWPDQTCLLFVLEIVDLGYLNRRFFLRLRRKRLLIIIVTIICGVVVPGVPNRVRVVSWPRRWP